MNKHDAALLNPPKMKHQEFEPPKELKDVIKCFWYNMRDYGDRLSGVEVVPDGYAEIIFHFGSGCSIMMNGDLVALPSPFMIGLLNQPVFFYAENCLEIIGVRCFPWTVFDLLGLNSGKDGVRVFEHPIAKLQAKLNDYVQAGRIQEAVGEVTQYFSAARSEVATDSLLYKAGVAMRAANGMMPVNQVARAAHVTIRTLERKFKKSSGYTVKDVSGLMRFEQVRNQLWIDPDSNLAGMAHALGYADQSHLSRDFKRYSGISPAAFARKAKKEVIINNLATFIQNG